ncbi:MAG: sensor histidine kinase [Bacteroidales bacterium]|nr:sensor histidine kinase [Bacteroidales bacterium]
MKSAKTYSLLITVMVVLFVALALMVNEIVGFKHTIIDYLVVGLVGMVGTFLIVRWYFIRFVETKIDPIIKTIQSYTMSQKSIRDKIDSGDVIDDLNKEVKVWADNHSEEIRKLRKLERYRKDFLGNVSHELKTPIFNIQGYILTLLDGGMEDNSINTLYLKRAERSTNRMINIVEDLDSIARLESGEFKLKLEVFNLVKVVEEVIEYLEMPANQKKIKVVFDKSYNRAIRVKADRKRIVEVFSNLIGNSVKYGKEGGKTTIGFTDTGDYILVNISDNGIGIEEKNLPRIFERFYRVDMSRSRESGGTGLGLSIVKHIIQAHNQTITVRSRVNEGSTFIFSMNKA